MDNGHDGGVRMIKQTMFAIVFCAGASYGTIADLKAYDLEHPPVRYSVSFINGSNDTSLPDVAANDMLNARPPHFYWQTTRQLENCKPDTTPLVFDLLGFPIVSGDPAPKWVATQTGPSIQRAVNGHSICEFTLPASWGCATIEMGRRVTWEDLSAEQVATPYGPEYPRLFADVTDDIASPLVIGVCPDPPLDPIAVPEPSILASLFAGIVMICALAILRPVR